MIPANPYKKNKAKSKAQMEISNEDGPAPAPPTHDVAKSMGPAPLACEMAPVACTGHQLKYSIPVLTYLSLNLKDKLLKQPFPHNSNMLVKVHRTNMGDWLKVLFFCFLPCWYKPTQPVSSRLQNYVINFHIIYVLSLNWHIYNIL